ncbi:FAD binding domain-containing protein [Rhodococcus fascians]|nr:FAD binding domain-containing protein [Rhodococcus fascians]MBY4237925.1 FAD binding domain-containing protein [Rhodococcus fascians]MBY4253324.1 FAD binding domain-containing protein [Rhodococcus fascians]MBY4268961.1 FAD binding domain-containing protein [Rhodococcus fascians]
MKPAAFDYERVDTVEAALALLASDADTKLLAGGQSLVTLMNLRLSRPSIVVDINRLTGLERVFDDRDAMVIGALVRHRTIETDPAIAARVPLLAAAAKHIGHIGIRNRGTLGGALAHSDPAAEFPMAALTLGATVQIESAARGVRSIPAEELFVSYYTSSLETDEMITWITVPSLRDNQGWAFVEYARQHGDYGLAGAGVLMTVDSAGSIAELRVAVLGAGDTPVLFTHLDPDIRGHRPGKLLWANVSREWVRNLAPSTTDPEYTRGLTASAIEEALNTATERAGDSWNEDRK